MPDQGFDRHSGVDQFVNEGRVRTIFEKAPHQIGQQVTVRAYRRIDANRASDLLDDYVVKRITHTVQALTLECPISGHVENTGHRVGVVGGELRVKQVQGQGAK